mgnify:CR=1 FL=1
MHGMKIILLAICCSFFAGAFGYIQPNPEPNEPNGTNATAPGNNNLTQEMAKKTAEALKTFNNVNYKSMSDNKESFFDSDSNPYTDQGSQQKTFKIEGASNDDSGSL